MKFLNLVLNVLAVVINLDLYLTNVIHLKQVTILYLVNVFGVIEQNQSFLVITQCNLRVQLNSVKS